jgi:hypothetical protein
VARKIGVDIIGNSKSLERAFDKSGKSASGFGKTMAKAGKFAALGLAGAGAAIAVGLKKSVDAALEAEKAQTRLDTAFKATGATAKQQAAAMQTVSRVSNQAALDDEDLMDSLGRLTRVTGDATKAQTSLAIAADLARARNLSLEAATKIVEKAHLGNVGALKRIGIEIPKVTAAQDALKASGDKYTTAQMAAAKATDDLATRQSAIAALQTQYAGASERYGQTAAGAQERFQVAVENLQEAIGAKLLPVLTRLLTWFVGQLPAIERITKQVFGAVADAIAFVRKVSDATWPKVQDAAQRVIAWYQGTLRPAVQNVVAAVTAIWDRFGGDITRIARTAFNVVSTVVRNGLAIIQAVVEGVLAVLRGDWTAAWNSLKTVVSRVFSSIGAIVRGFASIAFAAASAIGAALIDGIIAGVSGLADRLRDKIVGGIRGAIGAAGSALKGSGDFMFTIHKVGVPLGQGVIEGWVKGSAPLPAKMKESLRNAIEGARAVVEASRGRLSEAFGALSSDALSAFDAIAGQVQTKTEKLLGKLQAARAASDRADAVTGARAALTAAQAGTTNDEGVRIVDAEAVKNAQKQLDDALWAQREFALQQRAEQERRELDARNTLRRRHFEEQLQALGSRLQKEGATIKEANQAVLKLLGKFGVDFKDVGSAMGKAWVQGLKEAIADAARGAGSLAKTIEKVSADIPGRAAGGPVSAGRTYMVGERGPELFVPGRSGSVVANGRGGGVVVNVYGDVTGNEIIETVRREINRIQKQNGRSVAV